MQVTKNISSFVIRLLYVAALVFLVSEASAQEQTRHYNIFYKGDVVGKMQFYLALLDDLVKQPHENPSIGIILCKSRDKTIVEYALRESHKPIGVAEYKIVSTLPEKLKGKLSSPEEISKLLEGIN